MRQRKVSPTIPAVSDHHIDMRQQVVTRNEWLQPGVRRQRPQTYGFDWLPAGSRDHEQVLASKPLQCRDEKLVVLKRDHPLRH